MIPAHEDFDGSFPFKPHFTNAPGFRMHYVDEGGGEPILCLHGEPTWGYLYRKFIPPLAHTHRVLVPDHMGFGKSETPQDREYTLRTHVENLTALIDELDLRDITFVAQDWGGPMAGAYTVRHPERVKRLCLMNTLLGYGGVQPPEVSPWFRWIARHYGDQIIAQGRNIRPTSPHQSSKASNAENPSSRLTRPSRTKNDNRFHTGWTQPGHSRL